MQPSLKVCTRRQEVRGTGYWVLLEPAINNDITTEKYVDYSLDWF